MYELVHLALYLFGSMYSSIINANVFLSSTSFRLHACVRFSPPPHIVQLLIDLVPESPSSVDCLRRCPLHVAAGTRASLSVIQMLTQAYPDACDIQDVDGKTPLTLTCDAACELFEGDQNSYGREPPSFQVVKILLEASGSSVPLEDNEGMSALEHAIFSDAPIEVIKLLQHVTRRQCEVQQKRRQSLEHSESERVHESTDGAISAIPAKKVSFHAKK